MDITKILPDPQGMTIQSFTSELREVTDGLVNGSLSQYVIYTLKEQEAFAYMADPKADIPLLSREAALKEVTVDELIKSVLDKAKIFKGLLKEVELLRIEFGIRYDADSSNLELRDELLSKVRALKTQLG